MTVMVFLNNLIDESGGRYQNLNNKDQTNCSQFTELITKLETSVKKWLVLEEMQREKEALERKHMKVN